MRISEFQDYCGLGMVAGAAIGLVPAAATTLIMTSKVIFIGVVANLAIGILTAGNFYIAIHGIPLVHVPVLWQISGVCLKVGAVITAISLIAFGCSMCYEHYKSSRRLENVVAKHVPQHILDGLQTTT